MIARKVGGNHEHGSDVELNCRLVIELASAANSTAATCEHPHQAMPCMYSAHKELYHLLQ